MEKKLMYKIVHPLHPPSFKWLRINVRRVPSRTKEKANTQRNCGSIVASEFAKVGSGKFSLVMPVKGSPNFTNLSLDSEISSSSASEN